MKIGIINLNVGNLGSVYSAFKFYNYNISLISRAEELETSDILVLTGVVNFSTAAGRIKEMKIWDLLNKEVIIKRKPILGICMGMQLFAELSREDGENEGLGWIRGQVVKMESNISKVPHIGWDRLRPTDKDLFQGMRDEFFYFMHSYHFIPEESDVTIGTVDCGDLTIVAAVKKGNIVGVQFHPEKSQGDGLRFLKNFVEVMS